MNKELPLSERLGGPIVHTFPEGHVLRDDKGIRDDEESYSLFMLCPDQTFKREGVWTGKREWAIEMCADKIAKSVFDMVEECWVTYHDGEPTRLIGGWDGN